MKILMVSSEAAPFAKSGGLADVVGSLPAALAELGVEAAVLLPRYGSVPLDGAVRVFDPLPIWLGGTRYDTALYRRDRGVPFYLLDYPPLYQRDGLYGNSDGDFPDNHLRFALLARSALEVARRVFRPRVIHCHDWQAGLVPAYLRGPLANDPTFLGVRTLFTIHNLGYPGRCPGAVLPQLGLDPAQFHVDGLEFLGDVSFLKAGLVYADALSTVSRTYAREIQTSEQGFGLDDVLRSRSRVLHGIVNGVDYSLWNPESDPYIAAHYSVSDLAGKRRCKQDLVRRMGLPGEALEKPLVGIVSRFAAQKGLDLIADIAEPLAAGDLSLVALGSGEAVYEELFRDLAAAHPSSVAVRIGYDDRLAHQIEAGSDIFLMPSHYEPCGLNQIYSLRYGTIPVVRATGGLDDTIEEGTGFKFQEYSGIALWEALSAALAAWRDQDEWTARMKRGMRKDFSWRVSAREYSQLYRQL
ncbi:MAG: glycogen synthase GlgA [Acidobacteria bacterium]|nr:glycogen synthase GlgA [Acidobacteriota bacterium]